MMLDSSLVFAQLLAITATAAFTNIIDQQTAGDAYEALWLVITCDVTAGSSAGTSTVDFQLQTSASSAFGSNTVLFDTSAIAQATLIGGTVVAQVRVPVGTLEFLRVYATVASGSLTAGKFSAYLTKDVKIGDSGQGII